MLLDGIYRWVDAPLHHMHPRKRVCINSAVCEIIIDVRPIGSGLHEVAVERDVLTCKGFLSDTVCPSQESPHQLCFSFLFWVGGLFLSKTIHLKCLLHDMCTVPDVAFFIELVCGVFQLDSPQRKYGVHMEFRSGRFDIKYDHWHIVLPPP